MEYRNPNRRANSGTQSRTARCALANRAMPLLALAVGVFFFVTIAWPQSDTQTAILKLSAGSQGVARQLAGLTELPAVQWKLHVGDVAHGESPDLNDRDWTTVVGSDSAHAPGDAVWYRRRIEVPKTLSGYDLTGAKIWFEFQASANGPMPQIIYYDGRRVAMGDDLEPIVLFDRAKPGDSALVAVKLLHTEDQKTFNGVTLRIDFAAGRPSPADFLYELLSAGNLAGSLGANSESVEQQIDRAAAAVDLRALENADQKAFDASIGKAHDTLEVVKPKLQATTVRLTGNSHIDAAWLWPWAETVEVLRHTFGTALQLMYEYPQYTYTQSAAAYSEWTCQKYPAQCDEIAKRVKEGRWELVGGMWVEPDLNMPDGESLVRQLLVGKRYFKQKFGVDVRIGWNPDSFGYNWQLPQIYKKSGVDYFVTQKMAWNDTNQLPMKLFWWQSPDGSRVLTYFPHDYANEIDPVDMARAFAHARQDNPGTTEMMHLYGIGDHGGGPTRAMLDAGDRWTSPDKAYARLDFGDAQSFFSAVEKEVDTAHPPVWNYKTLAAGDTKLPQPPAGLWSLPVWNDELYFEYHRGVMTSQAAHKRNMRESEEEVLDAEKWSALAWLGGTPYPGAELNEAWKKVLFNQFHDLAAGSGIGVIYKDAQKDYDMVRFTADEATRQASTAIASYVDTQTGSKGVPILVFNPLGWERSGVVEFTVQLPAAASAVEIVDEIGQVLGSESSVKNSATHTFTVRALVPVVSSLGYALVYARAATGAKPAGVKVGADGHSLENRFLRVTVDPKTGCITSLVNKQTNFDAIAAGGCGNRLQAFVDTPKEYDAWNIDADFAKVFTNLDMVDSVELREHDALRGVIRISRHWGSS